MKMVVLVENSSRCRLCAEHGLSVYIEYEGKTYLLDTGATTLFAENAKELGIDLSKVDTAFLSHAHYDHSGGFEEFFKENDKQRSICRRRLLKTAFTGQKEKINILEFRSIFWKIIKSGSVR